LVKQRAGGGPRLWPESRNAASLLLSDEQISGRDQDWYSEPIRERHRMMRDHGMIGRHYAGRVTQIISAPSASTIGNGASIFLPTTRWSLKLVYEMRFDEASAIYGLFGTFFVGLRFPSSRLESLFDGQDTKLT